MCQRNVLWIVAVTLALAGIAGALHRFHGTWFDRKRSGQEDLVSTGPSSEGPESASADDSLHSPLPRLPETSPPPGLPIIPWGKRDHFPVIRNPVYWTAEQGDKALARDEPVLGLVIGSEARAYSTNQLNDHELVVDSLAGTPILVTY
jgi:hypothetical protein